MILCLLAHHVIDEECSCIDVILCVTGSFNVPHRATQGTSGRLGTSAKKSAGTDTGDASDASAQGDLNKVLNPFGMMERLFARPITLDDQWGIAL